MVDLDAEVGMTGRGLLFSVAVAVAAEDAALRSSGGLVDEEHWSFRCAGAAGADLTRPCDRVCFNRCSAAAVLGMSAMHWAGLAGSCAPTVMSARGGTVALVPSI